jgi:endonuclease/exonuclease/phosphatase family metal-dependent hydrolase
MNHRLRLHSRLAVVLVVVAVASVFVPTASLQATGPARVTVITRNLYLGSGLTNLATAPSFPQFVDAVTTDWNNVVANDFPRRAKALATEIQLFRPDVVGLQEAMLFREQLVSDIVQGNPTPNATVEVYDFVEILQSQLAGRGVPYTVVSTSVNGDAEAPRRNAESPIGFTDVRLTDRDVILVRAAIADRFSNPQDGHYQAQFSVATVGGPLTFTRGWASIDYAIAPGRTVRVFDTHLETTGSAAAEDVQVAQGNEAVDLIDASPHPVIALGDFNSAADGSTTPTYANLIGAGFQDVWTSVQPFNPGRTCCQPELLDRFRAPSERIDLILTEGSWHARLAVRTGILPFRLSPPPLWASDHFGVFATLELR